MHILITFNCNSLDKKKSNTYIYELILIIPFMKICFALDIHLNRWKHIV